jgi:MFS family permease
VTTQTKRKATSAAIWTACVLSAVGIACWNLMPVTLGSAADAYSLSDQQLGLLASSLLTGWLIATVLAFFFMHKIDRRWVTANGACVAALASIASQFGDGLSLLYMTWGIAGFGIALVYCVSIQLISELGDIERSFGFKLVSEVSGGAILLYVFPVFIISVWHYAGASYGVAAVYLSSLIFLPWVTPYAPIQKSVTQNERESAPLVAWITLGATLIFLSGITGLWAFMERIGTDVGVTSNQMGIFLAILKLVGGLAGLTMVFASAKYGIRWPHIVALLCISISVLILHMTQSVSGYAVGTWIWEFGFTLGIGYQFAVLARLDTSKRLLLLIPSCIGLAGMIGPALAGYIKDGDSYANVYIFAAMFALIPTIILMSILSKERLAMLSEQGTPI